MAFLKLRNKILISLLITTLLFGLGMVLFAETFIHNKLHNMLREKGIVLAKRAAADCIKPIITGHYFEITMMFKDMMLSEKDMLYAYVLNEDGKDLAHTFSKEVPDELKIAHQADPANHYSAKDILTDKGNAYDIAVPLLGGQIGVLHIGLSDAAIKKDVNAIVLSIILFSVFVLVLGNAVSAIFSSNITKPLSTLAGAAEAFGKGEMNHMVLINSNDEIGELSKVFNIMMENLKQNKSEREQLILELQEALNNVKTLSEILPICSYCKKIRDDKGYWEPLDTYVMNHTDTEFSHGMCPECAEKVFKEFEEYKKKSGH